MIESLEEKLQKHPHPYLTDMELETWLGKSTPDCRYGKVKRLLAQGKLLHIRRGLYCLTEKIGYFNKPHPFELAQRIYGPSYISLESALSFHQLIPEAVYTITSASSKRSRTFKTPLGLFSYLRLPSESLYTSVMLIKENGYQFFMAKPWKAISDYVFCYKKDWKGIEPLIGDLRLDVESLPLLSSEEMELLDEYYHNKRVSRFLKSVRKDLEHNYFL